MTQMFLAVFDSPAFFWSLYYNQVNQVTCVPKMLLTHKSLGFLVLDFLVQGYRGGYDSREGCVRPMMVPVYSSRSFLNRYFSSTGMGITSIRSTEAVLSARFLSTGGATIQERGVSGL